MPTISSFYGILIQMYWNEHQPPHFHALYGEHRAVIELATLKVVRGSLPRRAYTHVVEWVNLHRAELEEDWQLCLRKQHPKEIAPLP